MPTTAQIQKALKQRQKAKRRVETSAAILQEIQKLDFRRTATPRDVADFTRQLATMIAAKLPLLRSLNLLAAQQKRPGFQALLREIARAVRQGSSLSDALAGNERVFDAMYANIVRVGEATGRLDAMLLELSDYLEKMTALKRKLLTAMAYPAMILVIASGALGFLIFGVLPTFTDLFRDFGAELPTPTKILLSVSDFASENALIIFIGFLLLGVLLRRIVRTEKGRYGFDWLKLKIPIISGVIKKILLARFARTLATLLHSGVSLLEALSITEKSVDNVHFRREITAMQKSAERGEPLEHALQRSKLFPMLVVQMLAVGEETAALPELLRKTAAFYEAEADAAIDALTSLIEPAIIVILGLVLGGAMLAIYLQIFELMNVVG